MYKQLKCVANTCLIFSLTFNITKHIDTRTPAQWLYCFYRILSEHSHVLCLAVIPLLIAFTCTITNDITCLMPPVFQAINYLLHILTAQMSSSCFASHITLLRKVLCVLFVNLPYTISPTSEQTKCTLTTDNKNAYKKAEQTYDINFSVTISSLEFAFVFHCLPCRNFLFSVPRVCS